MKEKKQTQLQRIYNCEKAITNIYIMLDAIMKSLPKPEINEKDKVWNIATKVYVKKNGLLYV